MLPIRDHNPSGRVPYITYSIIFVNCVIFFSYWGSLNDPKIINNLFTSWGLIPYRLTQGNDPFTLLSSIFLHGCILHLAGNMLFFHIFVDNFVPFVKFLFFFIFFAGLGPILFITLRLHCPQYLLLVLQVR